MTPAIKKWFCINQLEMMTMMTKNDDDNNDKYRYYTHSLSTFNEQVANYELIFLNMWHFTDFN